VTKLCSCASICLTAAAASGELRPDCRCNTQWIASPCLAVSTDISAQVAKS
jgi:hypothetical protein